MPQNANASLLNLPAISINCCGNRHTQTKVKSTQTLKLLDLDCLDNCGVRLCNCNLHNVEPVLQWVQMLEHMWDVNLCVQRLAAVAGTLLLKNYSSIWN